MSLGIAVLTEEGVVLATESLGTLLTTKYQAIELTCNECGFEGKPNISCGKCNKILGPVPTLSHEKPVSHTYHCQKLFQINSYVGLITIGKTKISGIKIQHRLHYFLTWLQEKQIIDDYCQNIAEHWITYCKKGKILTNHSGRNEFIFAGIKSKGSLEPYSTKITIEDDTIQVETQLDFGLIMAGSCDVIDKIFGENGIKYYPVKEFPLQDAVAFVEFLIKTQIGVEKYMNRISRVGGEIDIALIHPIYGFKWVKQKKLQQILET
ncbi:hypothetical protein JW960_15960 [candidate division KSB1 bacterium]|nr:hypothetical protein [candidate division KSB1 bacterium]